MQLQETIQRHLMYIFSGFIQWLNLAVIVYCRHHYIDTGTIYKSIQNSSVLRVCMCVCGFSSTQFFHLCKLVYPLPQSRYWMSPSLQASNAAPTPSCPRLHGTQTLATAIFLSIKCYRFKNGYIIGARWYAMLRSTNLNKFQNMNTSPFVYQQPIALYCCVVLHGINGV